jgi:hypothetical protein
MEFVSYLVSYSVKYNPKFAKFNFHRSRLPLLQ